MTTRIKWINENPGAARDEQGYWVSSDARFCISPNYRHTVNPDSYTVRDTRENTRFTHDTVRRCKEWASWQLETPSTQEGK